MSGVDTGRTRNPMGAKEFDPSEMKGNYALQKKK